MNGASPRRARAARSTSQTRTRAIWLPATSAVVPQFHIRYEIGPTAQIRGRDRGRPDHLLRHKLGRYSSRAGSICDACAYWCAQRSRGYECPGVLPQRILEAAQERCGERGAVSTDSQASAVSHLLLYRIFVALCAALRTTTRLRCASVWPRGSRGVCRRRGWPSWRARRPRFLAGNFYRRK
jgi:hypothetical protein